MFIIPMTVASWRAADGAPKIAVILIQVMGSVSTLMALQRVGTLSLLENFP